MFFFCFRLKSSFFHVVTFCNDLVVEFIFHEALSHKEREGGVMEEVEGQDEAWSHSEM